MRINVHRHPRPGRSSGPTRIDRMRSWLESTLCQQEYPYHTWFELTPSGWAYKGIMLDNKAWHEAARDLGRTKVEQLIVIAEEEIDLMVDHWLMKKGL